MEDLSSLLFWQETVIVWQEQNLRLRDEIAWLRSARDEAYSDIRGERALNDKLLAIYKDSSKDNEDHHAERHRRETESLRAQLRTESTAWKAKSEDLQRRLNTHIAENEATSKKMQLRLDTTKAENVTLEGINADLEDLNAGLKKKNADLEELNTGLKENNAALLKKLPVLFHHAVLGGLPEGEIINFLAHPDPTAHKLSMATFGLKPASKPVFGPMTVEQAAKAAEDEAGDIALVEKMSELK